MVWLTEVAAVDQMAQIAHRGNESVRECSHVPNVGLVRRGSHLPRIGSGHGDRLLAKDMLAVRNCGERDGFVRNIRSGDDDRVHIIALHDVLEVRGNSHITDLRARLFKRRFARVAKCGDAHIPAKRKAGKMILKGDAAGADDREIQGTHYPERTAGHDAAGKRFFGATAKVVIAPRGFEIRCEGSILWATNHQNPTTRQHHKNRRSPPQTTSAKARQPQPKPLQSRRNSATAQDTRIRSTETPAGESSLLTRAFTAALDCAGSAHARKTDRKCATAPGSTLNRD